MKTKTLAKHLLSCILVLCTLEYAQAQATYICDEHFSSKAPQGWSIQPAFSATTPSWKTDTDVVVSAKYAMHGHIPFTTGDTIELVTPFFDCSNYAYVLLRFKHICKVLPSDICEIQYQEQGLGTNYKWKAIPWDAYKGGCALYRTDLNFSHASYSDWKMNDTFAKPNSGWFKEESFDLSNYASFSKVRFRFIIRKGGYFGSYIASGWYVDDFQLLGSQYEIKPPVVEFLTGPHDIIYSTGPYRVEAKVATRTALKIVPPVLECSFTYNGKTTKSKLPMSRIDGDSIWTATIPQQVYGTFVSYSINGKDSAGNTTMAYASFLTKMGGDIKDSNSVAMFSIDEPSKSATPGKNWVRISLRNRGFKNLTSATVNWKVNNVLQAPKTYKGNLPCDFTDTLTLGSYTQRSGTFDTITIWVSMPNNIADPVRKDDTLSIRPYGCSPMHGTFTIGKSTSLHHYDFASIDEIMDLLKLCGMGGEITMKFASGVYASAIDLTSVTSNTHRITIASLAGNADSVTFRPTTGPVVNLEGKQKLCFRDITLDAGASNGYAVALGNRTQDITFSHCRITAPEIVIFQNYYASVNISDIRFIGNDITGETNICGVSSRRNSNIVFDSNRVTSVATGHKYGIRLEYTDRVTISNNQIQEAANSSLKDFDGISVYGSDSCIISGNRIHARGFAYDYQHGIYCYYLDSQSVISNNEIIMEGSGSVYGCCIEYPYGTKIINNSILVCGKSSRTYGGLYITGNFWCEAKNNICVARGATYSYPMYITSSSSLGQCQVDYNCLWGDKYVGYVGSGITTLATYKSLLVSAFHDINRRPLFKDSTQSLELSSYFGLKCPIHPAAPRDINGLLRVGKETVIGCHNDIPAKNSAALIAISGLPSTSSAGDTVCPKVILQNCGSDTLKSASIRLEHNLTVQGSDMIWRGSLALGESDTVAVGSIIMSPGQNEIKAYLTGITPGTDAENRDDTVYYSIFCCQKSFAGSYTVGPQRDFPNLDSAFSEINRCGMSGDITLKIASGVYTSAIDLSSLSGNPYSITITSLAGNADSVIFRPVTGTVVSLTGKQKLAFRNITLNASTLNWNAVLFGNGTKEIEFSHCRITGPGIAVFHQNNGTISDIRFIGNVINGETNICGSSNTRRNSGIVFDSNIVTSSANGHKYGIRLEYADIVSITHNRIQEPNSSINNFDGISVYGSDNCVISGNRIHARGYANDYQHGIYCYYLDSNSVISNNDIIMVGTGSVYGFCIEFPSGAKIINNSILVCGKSTRTYGGIYVTGNFQCEVKNNICVARGATYSYPMFITSAASLGQCMVDYNCLWGDNYVGYVGSGITTMAAYHNLLASAVHDINRRPLFKDSTQSLELCNYAGLSCPIHADALYDINGNLRTIRGNMGCYAEIILKNDAALTGLHGFSQNLSAGDTVCPYVILENCGSDTLKSATIRVEHNKTIQGNDFIWKGSLALGESDTISLGCIIMYSGQNDFKAYLTGITPGTDAEHRDDTVSYSAYCCKKSFAGSYTVGQQGDFPDIGSAINEFNRCGMNGDITLKMISGVYSSAIDLSALNNNPYRITITSLTGNAANVIFRPTIGPVVNLDGKQKLCFRDITLDAGSTTDYAVKLGDGTHDVTFSHCRITKTGIVICKYSNGIMSGIRFIGNEIKGGTFIGGNRQRNTDIVFDSNHIISENDGGKYGIRLEYANRVTISHNYIQDANASVKDFDGISVYASDSCLINGNRIHARGHAYDYQHGIYCYYLDSNSIISNNDIIMVGAGSVYGFCIEYPSGAKIINNSILVCGKSTRTYGGIYVTGNFQCEVKNNICVTRGATYSYPIFLTTQPSPGQCMVDYNCLWGDKYVANIGTGITTMAAYQSMLASAVHDINQRPLFIDSTISLEINNYTGLICPRHTKVPRDIKDEQRTSLTTMGAYGAKLYEGVNISAVEFVQPLPPADIACYADHTPVSVAITNMGLKNADFKTSALKVSMDITGAISLHFDTLITSGTIGYMQIDTISLGSIPTINAGVYNIKVTLADTADKVPEDDTLSMVHRAYRVELPYDVNFSTVPAEFISSVMAGKTEWEVRQGSGNNPALAPSFGTGRLEFAGASVPGSSANAIFNAVNIYNCVNPTLSFWFAHNAACKTGDMLMVFVTTDGGATLTEIRRIAVADTATAWKQYDIDLTPFNQQSCLSILFRAVSFGGSDQAIDRIRITAEKDASFEFLPIDLTQRTACDNTPVDIKAVLHNETLMGIGLYNDTLTLNVTGAVNYNKKYVYNKKLGGLESDTVTLGQINLSVNGKICLEAYMQSFDDNTANDTTRDSSFIMQDIAIDTVLGLDDQMHKLGGEQVAVTAIVTNNGNIPVDNVILHMSIDGSVVLSDTVHKRLGAGDTIIHPMSKAFTVPFVNKDQPYYFFELKAELPCDADNNNNLIQIIGNVDIPDSIDIQVLEITTTAQELGKTKLAPSVRVANIGNMAVENVLLHVDVVNDSNRVVESISENISHMAINETKNHLFTMTYRVPDYTGQYTLRAYVEAFDGDSIRSNDTIARQFRCYRDSVGIRSIAQYDWSLGQNIPNPTGSEAVIPFRLPQDDEVVFCIMTANGQVVHRRTIQAVAGENRITLDASGWAAGIYYYSMEYKGQRIVRKMSVVR